MRWRRRMHQRRRRARARRNDPRLPITYAAERPTGGVIVYDEPHRLSGRYEAEDGVSGLTWWIALPDEPIKVGEEGER